MKVLKLVGIPLIAYVGMVVAFESLLGYFQPAGTGNITLITRSTDGEQHSRVLSRIDSDGQLFVAANHWPRAWFRRALANPGVLLEMDGTTAPYQAVPASGSEIDRLQAEHGHGLAFKVLTGFPPRRFLRLDPDTDATKASSG